MYEPVWFLQKTLSAVAEAVAAIGALCLFVMTARGRLGADKATPVPTPSLTTTDAR